MNRRKLLLPPRGGLREPPGHDGETPVGWPGNASGSLEELDRETRRGTAGLLLRLLQPRPRTDGRTERLGRRQQPALVSSFHPNQRKTCPNPEVFDG